MTLKKTILFTLLPAALLCSASLAEESVKEAKANKQTTGKKSMSSSAWSGKKSTFHGYEQVDFKLGEVPCKVVIPKKIADGKPWVWRARFWAHEPQFDLAMLECGYYVVFCDVGNLFGSPEADKRWDECYDYLRFEHLFADRAILVGMSRGGLII